MSDPSHTPEEERQGEARFVCPKCGYASGEPSWCPNDCGRLLDPAPIEKPEGEAVSPTRCEIGDYEAERLAKVAEHLSGLDNSDATLDAAIIRDLLRQREPASDPAVSPAEGEGRTWTIWVCEHEPDACCGGISETHTDLCNRAKKYEVCEVKRGA